MNKKKIKGLLKSKTFWFNVFSVAAGVPAILTNIAPPEFITTVAGIGNVGLRLITSQPLEEK